MLAETSADRLCVNRVRLSPIKIMVIVTAAIALFPGCIYKRRSTYIFVNTRGKNIILRKKTHAPKSVAEGGYWGKIWKFYLTFEEDALIMEV